MKKIFCKRIGVHYEKNLSPLFLHISEIKILSEGAIKKIISTYHPIDLFHKS